MKLFGVAFQCLFAVHFLYFHRAASQSQLEDVPTIRVNDMGTDVLVSSGSRVELSCYTTMGSVNAVYILNRLVELPSDSGSNLRVIQPMSAEYQGTYHCQTTESKKISSNELALISKWRVTCMYSCVASHQTCFRVKP